MEDNLQADIASYATIGSGNLFSNACYDVNSEFQYPEKTEETFTKKAGNNSLLKIMIMLLVLLIVLVSAGLIVGIAIKFSLLNQTVGSIKTGLDIAKGNLSRILEAISSTGLHSSFPASSCASILTAFSTSKSGYYWIKTTNGSSALMFCDMKRICGGIRGGWTRVANLNMTDPNAQCPPQLHESTYLTDIRTCAVPAYLHSCVSVFYNIEGIKYSRVCGRVLGYQYGSTDSFFKQGKDDAITIDSNYVDGISLTRGSPREHIWTLAAGHCMEECYFHSPPFISNNYFCDGVKFPNCTKFCDVTLWNGEYCDTQRKWFYNQLPQRKSEAIEMRLCQDEGSTSEHTPIVEVELYVQ